MTGRGGVRAKIWKWSEGKAGECHQSRQMVSWCPVPTADSMQGTRNRKGRHPLYLEKSANTQSGDPALTANCDMNVGNRRVIGHLAPRWLQVDGYQTKKFAVVRWGGGQGKEGTEQIS